MARVSKWGNSLAVRLPASLGFEEGQEVFIRKGSDGEVIVSTDAEAEAEEKAKRERRAAAIKKLGSLKWKLPPGYKFDRDEAHER
jgi:antitoxin MazE